MATAGHKIQQSSFSTGWAQQWSDSHGNKDETRYVYMCCPAWYIAARAESGVLNGCVQVYISYYDGSAWSSETHYEVDGRGGTKTRYYAHNRDEGNLSGSFHSHYPLWRVRYWPSRNNDKWSITIWAGGWGVAINTSTGDPINYPIGEKIKSRGRTGTNVCIHADGTNNREQWVRDNIFRPSARYGFPILAGDDSELVHYPYTTT